MFARSRGISELLTLRQALFEKKECGCKKVLVWLKGKEKRKKKRAKVKLQDMDGA